MSLTPRPARIVVLTGAGISRESGLHTFRDADGIWAQVDLADVATPEAFARNPSRVQDFYNARRRALGAPGIAPNAAHLALARLGHAMGTALTLVTQNVDDLHERAGSAHAIHMHGALNRARCTACDGASPWASDITAQSACPACNAACLRPDIVWFGEMPMHMDRIAHAIEHADLFVSIGTSGSVYPAAGLVSDARSQGAATLELNLEPSEGSRLFDEARHGPATTLVPAWVDGLIGPAPGPAA